MSELDPDIYNKIHDEVFQVDRRITAWFYTHAVKDGQASADAGRPVYKDVPYLGTKGKSNKDFVTRPATDEDISTHKEAWRAYQQRKAAEKHHSLLLLPGVTPAIKKTFEDMGVYTIEQLMGHTGEIYPEVMPFFEMCRILKKAFDFIETGEKPKMRFIHEKEAA